MAIFSHLKTRFCNFPLYIRGIAIALVIHSLDPRWGFGVQGFGISTHLQDLYRTRYSLA